MNFLLIILRRYEITQIANCSQNNIVLFYKFNSLIGSNHQRKVVFSFHGYTINPLIIILEYLNNLKPHHSVLLTPPPFTITFKKWQW